MREFLGISNESYMFFIKASQKDSKSRSGTVFSTKSWKLSIPETTSRPIVADRLARGNIHIFNLTIRVELEADR